MNLNELKIRIAEILGVSDSEKELAFEIFIYNTFNVLDSEETLKVPRIGFFQYKTKPFKISGRIISDDESGSKNTIVYSPLTKDLLSGSRSMFLTIDVSHQKKDLFELDESVFSISVGKPILPISSEIKNGGDSETSYILLKKSIEERVGEIISESELLKNFDIWEDHLSDIDVDTEPDPIGSSSTIHKLTDDIEYTEEEIRGEFIIDEDADTKDKNLESSGINIDEEIIQHSEKEESPLELPENKKTPGVEEIDFEKKSEKDMNDEELNDEDFPSFENYNDFKHYSEEEPEEFEKLEINDQDETNVFPNHSVRKPKDSDKFWGMDDFKSSSETRDENKEKENENEENVDWDWGDELLEGKDDDSIDVSDFGKDENDEEVLSEPDKEELFNGAEEEFIEVDDEKVTNLFINLENSLSGAKNGSDNSDRVVNEEIIIDEDEIGEEKMENKEENFKSTYIKNLLIAFGAVAVIVILIFVFVSPGDDEPVQNPLSTTQDDSLTDLVTGQPVESEMDNEDNMARVDENPIEERTRQMQQSGQSPKTTQQSTARGASTTAAQGDLYRNIPNERSVRGLIFTDGSKYFVQVSSWPTKTKAEVETRRLRGLGYEAFIVEAYIQKFRATWYRVKIGYFNSIAEADRFMKTNKF